MQNLLLEVKDKLGKPYEDLEKLLTLLKEVLLENNEEELANSIPWINDNTQKPEDFTIKHLQIYSIAFQLLNMAEVNAAVQQRRKVEGEHQFDKVNGLWVKSLQGLLEKGFTAEEIADSLHEVRVEAVFTAHPTEAKRDVVLQHHRTLFQKMVQNENTMFNDVERLEIRGEIKLLLEKLWRTGEIYKQKPNVLSELKNVIYYMTNILPEVIPMLDKRLEMAWKELGLDPKLIEDYEKLPRVTFGDWVGGDRDGHPLVTADVTKDTLYSLRLNSFIVFRRQVIKLLNNLTFEAELYQLNDAFVNRFNTLVQELGVDGEAAIGDYPNEVFRQYVNLISVKLPIEIERQHATKIKEKAYSYSSSTELIPDLKLLQDALIEFGADSVARTDVHEAIRVCQSFGFHLAHLDIRQNSDFHDKAVAQIMNSAGLNGDEFLEWNEEQRVEFLNKELESNRPFTHSSFQLDDNAKTVLDCLNVVSKHVNKYGEFGLGSLIVSMTRNLSDLLVVFLLARETGLTIQTEDGLACRLPVVPLLETIEDLENGPEILDGFLNHPVAQRSLEYQKKIRSAKSLSQQVMVGYSDSNKDGGIISSQWGLYKAQAKLALIGRKYGVKIRFFHGKGGSISRGAGPAHWFIRSLPQYAVSGDLRLTEQGETIAQKYSSRHNARYNLELLLAGTAARTIADEKEEQGVYEFTDIFEKISKWSQEYYVEMLNKPEFIKFFAEATPIDALEQSKIGSRPARRTGKRSLADLRAIPWVFSWSQTRYNITSWYGIGSTLERLKKESNAEWEALKLGIKTDPFIRYVFTNVDTSLASTDEEIMRLYASLVTDDSVKTVMLDLYLNELRKTRELLLELMKKPIDERRVNHHYSTMLRSDAMSDLHKQQVSLLKKWREEKANNDPKADVTIMNLLMSINAIASAMQTTG